jgi:AraC-like DNA-binding protein
MTRRRHAIQDGGAAAPEFFSPQVAEALRFYRDLNPPARSRLAVVCGGLEHCTPDYLIRRETFPFYSIEYVVRGRGLLKLNGRRHALGPGGLFSYSPAVAHEMSGAPDDPLVKYFVDFAGTCAEALLDSCRLSSGRVAQVFPPNALSALFDELIESGMRPRAGSDVLCAALLECLALKIAESKAPSGSAETIAFTTYHRCRRYIGQHFLRLRTLRQISQGCHVNDAYLCRLFRHYDHQSPYQYLLRLKMNRAAELLQRPGALVKQAGETVGFSDPFHFSRAFRNVLGVSPAAFRTLR